MNHTLTLKKRIQQSIDTKQAILQNAQLLGVTAQVAQLIIDAYKAGKKVLWCGNGGSAADAQHLAAELSGRYYFDRPPLNSEAMHVNTSYITAVSNDYGYDVVYSRLIKAIGNSGDILIGMSTSGNSVNVINAMVQARTQGIITVAMTGETGGNMKAQADYLINIPSTDTPRIQECHMLLGHTLCELIEMELFGKE